MKKLIAFALSLVSLSAVCFATDYVVSSPKAGPFTRDTSATLTYVEQNVDKSKTAAIIPPAFGSASSYVPVQEFYLTPNLVGTTTGTTTTPTVTTPTVTTPVYPEDYFGDYSDLYEDWYDDYIYSKYDVGDVIGYLSIPEIDISTTVYEGTTDSNLLNGVGHFVGTGITSGNICIAGHNRGYSDIFGDIHTLDKGDNIYYTVDGTKTHYDVVSVTKISVNNTAVLEPTSKEQLTLITCVANQPSYRWCIVAK